MNMDVSPNSLVDKIKKKKRTKMQERKKVLQSNLSLMGFRHSGVTLIVRLQR